VKLHLFDYFDVVRFRLNKQEGLSGIGSTKVPTIMNGVGLVDLQPHILLDFTWAKWGCFRKRYAA